MTPNEFCCDSGAEDADESNGIKKYYDHSGNAMTTRKKDKNKDENRWNKK